ncbi:DUF3579 domain-containing protein [Pseudomonadota bacterium]
MKRRCKLVVRSVNLDGRKFRPSDWIERISAHLATFGPDHRLHYSEDVQPSIVGGEKCLVVDPALKANDPSAYEYIMKFVETNRLEMNEVCETQIEDLDSGAKAS